MFIKLFHNHSKKLKLNLYIKYSHTYVDELDDNEANSNLRKLGKIVIPFILIWCFKTCIAITIDIPERRAQLVD
jgi:hypothetical protein